MLTVFGASRNRSCGGLSRREFLRVGALGLGGLSAADLLRLRAEGMVDPGARARSVIYVYLFGGPSHIDTYDMKPDAPAEVRGEFHPMHSNVPGMDMCELFTEQARIADKFSVVRSATWVEPDHQRIEIFTGFPRKERRPSFGSCVSRFTQRDASMPKFVSLQGRDGEIAEAEDPLWAGAQHRAFVPEREGMKNLEITKSVDLTRLRDRKQLLDSLDRIRRDVDAAGQMGAMDTYSAQALDMLTSGKARKAFDISDEPEAVLEPYKKLGGKFRYLTSEANWDWQAFVRARRLVEAGVPFVSMQVGLWDHHCDANSGSIFKGYRSLLPLYDHCISALINDLHSRGLDKDVCVVAWGEFGRTPKLNQYGGRDHWPNAGSVLFAGGGLKMGQYIGATNKL